MATGKWVKFSFTDGWPPNVQYKTPEQIKTAIEMGTLVEYLILATPERIKAMEYFVEWSKRVIAAGYIDGPMELSLLKRYVETGDAMLAEMRGGNDVLPRS